MIFPSEKRVDFHGEKKIKWKKIKDLIVLGNECSWIFLDLNFQGTIKIIEPVKIQLFQIRSVHFGPI